MPPMWWTSTDRPRVEVTVCLKRSNLFMAGSGRSRILILTIHNVFCLCKRESLSSSVFSLRRAPTGASSALGAFSWGWRPDG